ncbi:hypothetical protein V1505DRAFT_57927 [Lipomyces doorenjongii]
MTADLQKFSMMIRQQHPMLGFVDGLHLPVEAAGDAEVQSFTSNVFVFSPLGTILYAMINAPGSMHDARSLLSCSRNCSMKQMMATFSLQTRHSLPTMVFEIR